MPTYQYACTDCEHFFEQVQRFDEDSLTVCPQCDGRLRKVFNAVGVVFKGSGFYRTDSRAESRNGSSTTSSKSSDSSGSSDSGSPSGSSSSGSSSSSPEPSSSSAGSSSASSGSNGSKTGSTSAA